MTSIRKIQSKRDAAAELRIFDTFSPALREAINGADASVKPSTILSTLMRGVSEEAIIEVINKRSRK